MAVYTVGDDYTSSAIQTAIDLIPGDLSGHGKEHVQVYAKAAGYAESLDAYGGFSNCSAVDYICIQAMVSHSGLRGQGIIIDVSTSSGASSGVLLSSHSVFQGFCIIRPSTNYSGINVVINPRYLEHNVTIADNIVYNWSTLGNYGIAIGTGDGYGTRIINNQVINQEYNSDTLGIWGIDPGAASAGNENQILNNTVLIKNSGTALCCGISSWYTHDYQHVKNNYSSCYWNSGYAFSFRNLSPAHNVITYNISSDATADDWGGDGNLISKAAANQFVSVSAGSEDLHLKATADCFRNGADMSQYFTHDCVNIPRKFWRTGAFETLPTVYSVNDGNPHKVYYSWGGNLAKVDGVDVPLRNTETMTDNDAATVAVGFSPVYYGQEFGGLVGDLKIFDQSDVKDTRP